MPSVPSLPVFEGLSNTQCEETSASRCYATRPTWAEMTFGNACKAPYCIKICIMVMCLDYLQVRINKPCALLQKVLSIIPLDRLYNRPAAGEVNLVDTELLLAIAVADAGVNVVVVEERSLLGVPVDTLTARTVHPAVGLKYGGTATLSALLPRLVDEAAGSAGGPADLDLVFGARSRATGVVSAALASREEEIVVVAALGNVGCLLSVLTFGLESDVGGRATGRLEGRVVHIHGK